MIINIQIEALKKAEKLFTFIAKPLTVTILIITLSTLLVGLIPSYEEIGILAPIIFILLRLIQGLSIGGEYSSIMIYLAESAPPKNCNRNHYY